MIYLKYFENNDKKLINEDPWIYNIRNYTNNPDGSIDVYGDAHLSNSGLKDFPIKFNHIYGNFYCAHNYLTTLQGGPKEVDGNFFCSSNKLTNLIGAPKVGGSFECYSSKVFNRKPFEFVPIQNPLPIEIKNNYIHINSIIRLQDDYGIWNRDGSLNKYRFSDMMEEIKNEND